jgi:hypothetical protein
MSEVIVRSALCAVKAARSPPKQVILAISFDAYKVRSHFAYFEKDKNYDGFENTRYSIGLDSLVTANRSDRMCE